MITADEDGIVKSIEPVTKSGARMNGGFFVLRREIFQYLREGEELVEEPFRRLIGAGQLLAFTHDGFWACMDTFKEMQQLEDLYGRGNAPWMVWNGHGTGPGAANETPSVSTVQIGLSAAVQY
jgi:glucose-1-phosphate cytidylyltransferase